jgi:hypothetical protein
MKEIRTGYAAPVMVERTTSGEALVTLRKATGTLPATGEGAEEQTVYEMHQFTTAFDGGLESRLNAGFESAFQRAAARESEALAAQERKKRDELMAASDFRVTVDYPATDEERNGWIAYRQALRDVPEQSGFPQTINWPTPPEREKANETLIAAIDAVIGEE